MGNPELAWICDCDVVVELFGSSKVGKEVVKNIFENGSIEGL